MTHDDHAALVQVINRLVDLHAQQRRAREEADQEQVDAVQRQIDAAQAERIEILRRTEPEDEPLL